MDFARVLPDFVRRRFVRKLGVGFLMVIVLVAGVGAYTVTQTNAMVTDDVQNRHQMNAEVQATAIGNWISTLDTIGATVSQADAIQRQVSDEISLFLTDQLQSDRLRQTVVGLHYVDATNGTVLSSSDSRIEGSDVTELGFESVDDVEFRADSAGLTAGAAYVVSRPYESRINDQPAIAVAAPIPDQPDRALLVVGDLEMFSYRLPQRTNDSYISVVDDRGTVVLSQHVGEILGRNAGSQDETTVDSPAVEQGLAGESGVARTATNETELTMGYAPVDGVDWVTMYHEPSASAFAVQQSVFRNLLLLIGSGIAGLLVVGVVVTRSTVRPLNRLTDRARTLKSGDLEAEIESARVDEFGQLSAAFADMRDSLRERISETERERERAQEARERASEAQEEAEALASHLQEKASEFSAVMARGAEGDLTVRMDPDSDSAAMRDIAESFNEMVAELRAVVDSIDEFATTVDESTDEIETSANDVQSASREVSEKVQEIANRADRQHETIREATDEMTDLSAAIEEVASSTDEVATTSSRAATVGTEGRTQATSAVDEMTAIEETAEETVAEIEQLDGEMDRIGEIVDLINDIAEQTNVLALNANIEAARAGENGDEGDGFAVVADEVKQLATETARKTEEVDERIAAVRESTERAVADVREMGDQVSEGKETVEGAVEQLEETVEAVERANSGVQTINDATDDQAASVEETVTMIESVGSISDETAAEAEDVAAATEEQVASLAEVSGNISSLAEQASALGDLVDEFDLSDGDQPERGQQSAAAQDD